MPPSQLDDVAATLDELETEAANEQVEALLGVVRSLYENQQTIASNQREINERVERLELLATSFGTIDEIEGVEDQRDKAVLKAIQARDQEEFSLRDFRQLYKAHTDVRKDETLRDRIRNLTQNGPFETCGRQKWLYVGGPHITVGESR